MNFKYIVFGLFSVLAAVGCGDAISVTGTVKFADGTPLTSGYVTFESDTTNVIGPLDKEGRFSLFQFKQGDRVPPGNYRGAIMYDISGAISNDNNAMKMTDEQITKKYLPFPPKYSAFSTSGLTLTVEAGKPVPKMEIVLEP